MYRKYTKRLLDIILSGTALVLLSPVLLVIALLVRIKLGSPVLFIQERPGIQGKVFHLYKFRSMTSKRDALGNLLPDGQRLTSFGKILRSTSLDELPELWNIIKGDMSIVGPRPLLVQYLPLYSKQQARRHEVRPGLTGYAQVNGRNAIGWQTRFDLDVWYVDHISFKNDTKIIMQTVLKIIQREGITSETSLTVEYFTGNQDEEMPE